LHGYLVMSKQARDRRRDVLARAVGHAHRGEHAAARELFASVGIGYAPASARSSQEADSADLN
jgi:hypothetical protein